MVIFRKFFVIHLYLVVIGVLFYYALVTVQLTNAAENKEETLEGTLEVIHQDDFQNKKSKETYFLKNKDERLELKFSNKKPEAKSGSKIKVKGNKKDGALAIGNDGFEVTAEVVITTATPKKVAVILINFQNNTSQPYTVTDAKSAIFTDSDSSKAYYQEASFNKLILEGKEQIEGDVFGWYTIPFQNTDCNDYWLWASAARNAAYNDGHNMEGYTNYIYAFPSTGTCSWGGLAYILGSESWINHSYLPYLEELVSHELGHNFGTHHASTYNCLDITGTRRVSISSNCTVDEYGDPFDVMGLGVSSYYHMSGFHKGQLGWFDGVNIQTITDNGTYNITPLETNSTGVQSLRIPRKNSSGNIIDYYYLEYRQPFGFDNFLPSDGVVNGVSIRIAPEYDQIVQSKLIDTTPLSASFSDSALALGEIFTDFEKNITVTLAALTPTFATVEVNVTSPATCLRANPGVSFSPYFQTGAPGQTLLYTLSVTNNDSIDCGYSSFTVTSSSHRDLTQTPDLINLTLNPGATVDTQINVTSASDSAAGVYNFQKIAVNNIDSSFTAGASGQYEVIVSDAIPPTVSITAPLAGSVISSSVTIEASASDNIGVDKIEFYEDSTLLGIATTDPYSIVWETTSFSNTVHNLLAKAYDLMGNIGTSEIISVEVDNLAPNVSITNPPSEASVSGTVNIQATASDAHGVDKVEFYIDNNLVQTLTNAPYSVSWDSSAYRSNSSHTIFAKAYDSLANVATSSSINVTVADTTSPVINITNPANGSSVSGQVQIRADATDDVAVSQVEFYVNGDILSVDSTTPYEANWNTASLPANSSYTLTAKAVDSSNNVATSSVVTVSIEDTTSPTVNITNPAEGSSVSGVVGITANASDDVSVTKVEFYVDSILQNTDNSSPYSSDWDTSALTQGSAHNLQSKAFDAANNITTSATISVTIKDTTSPTVSLITPANGTQVTGIVNLTATASDNVGVTMVDFLVDGVVVGNDSTSSYSLDWDTAGLAQGSVHTITVNAYDQAGNLGSSSVVIVTIADTISPTTALTSPANGSLVTGVVYITASASDNIGVTKVEFYVNSSLLSSDTTSPYSANWDTSFLPQGVSHNLTSKAYDSAGNTKTSSNINVTIQDTIFPTVSVTSPTDASTVNGEVTLIATASDNVGVTMVDFLVDGVVVSSDSISPYSVSWNSINAVGSHTITVIAYDQAGNSQTSESVNITVLDITPPSIPTNLVATASTTPGRVDLSWSAATDNVGVVSYDVYRNDVKVGTSASTSYSDTNLTQGITYSYQVLAVDLANNKSVQSTASNVYVPDLQVPQGSITSPANGAQVTGIVNLTATASDNVGVTMVDFLVDGVVVGNDSTVPYSFSWDTSVLAQGSSHTISANIYDQASNMTATSNVTVTIEDITSPTTAITNPTSDAVVTGIINITASASDNIGVTEVEFYVDNNLVSTDTTSPYSTSWDASSLTQGSIHTIKSKAFDAAANVFTSASINVTIQDITSPIASVTSPANGAQVTGIVNLTATASDNVGVTMVDFLVDGVVVGNDSTSPYSINLDTSTYTQGSIHTITANAYDAASNFGSSTPITVTIKDITLPTTSIIFPVNNGTVKKNKTTTITANASDNIAVTKVEFYVSGVLKCTDTASPYSCAWAVPNQNRVFYDLQTKAYDGALNVGVSSIVTAKSIN